MAVEPDRWGVIYNPRPEAARLRNVGRLFVLTWMNVR